MYIVKIRKKEFHVTLQERYSLISELISLVEKKYELEKPIQDTCRKRPYAMARQTVAHILMNCFNLSLTSASKWIARDHSSVIYHRRQADIFLELEPQFAGIYNQVLNKLFNRVTDLRNLKQEEAIKVFNEQEERKLLLDFMEWTYADPHFKDGDELIVDKYLKEKSRNQQRVGT